MEEKNKNNLEKAIFATLAFFDIFDFPLTAWEIYKYLYGFKAQYREVLANLENMVLEEKIGFGDGFYFLPGKSGNIISRKKNYYIAEKKYKIVGQAVKRLKFINGIKLICVCNNLSFSNSRQDSDIDFFIVVAKNRLWLTRLLTTLTVQALGLRRHNQKIASRICLSFYVAEDHIDLWPITLRPSDPYFYYWLAALVPVYNQEFFNYFFSSNDWLKKYLPNVFCKYTNSRRLAEDSFFSVFKKNICHFLFFGPVGGWAEKFVKKLQLKKMSVNSKSAADTKDTRVIISDTILKFHEQDRRAQYLEAFQNKLRHYVS